MVLGVLFYSWTFVGFLLSWIIGGKGVWPHLLPPTKFTMQDGWYVDRKLVFLVVFRTHSLTTVASSQFTMVLNYVQTVKEKCVAWNSFKESFFKFQYWHISLVLFSQILTLCPNWIGNYDRHPHSTCCLFV